MPIGAQPRQLLSPEVAAKIDQMIVGVRHLQQRRRRAVHRYSPSLNLLTAIWMGSDDNRPAEAASGALVAELWGRYMQQVAGQG